MTREEQGEAGCAILVFCGVVGGLIGYGSGDTSNPKDTILGIGIGLAVGVFIMYFDDWFTRKEAQ